MSLLTLTPLLYPALLLFRRLEVKKLFFQRGSGDTLTLCCFLGGFTILVSIDWIIETGASLEMSCLLLIKDCLFFFPVTADWKLNVLFPSRDPPGLNITLGVDPKIQSYTFAIAVSSVINLSMMFLLSKLVKSVRRGELTVYGLYWPFMQFFLELAFLRTISFLVSSTQLQNSFSSSPFDEIASVFILLFF